MNIVLILAFVILLAGLSFKIEREDYLDKKQTESINGFFILLVFMCHFRQYVELSGKYDEFFMILATKMGQLVVTTFLFYSGYAIVKQIENKGKDYVLAMPKNRILKTMLLFDAAIWLFVIVDIAIGEVPSVADIILAMFGWISIGNSNWYIFAILVMYTLTYLSFRIGINKSRFISIFINSIFVCIYVLVIMKFKNSVFYNTVLCYVLGMWFAYFKTYIDKVMKKWWIYSCSTGIMIVAFLFFYINKDANLLINQFSYFAFVLAIVLITMKVEISNKILLWLGKHLMPLFILQRIPMLIMGKYEYFVCRPYCYFLLSLVITLVMAFVFEKTVVKWISTLFK